MASDNEFCPQRVVPTTYTSIAAEDVLPARRLAAIGKFGPGVSAITHDSVIRDVEETAMDAAIQRAAAFRAASITSLIAIQAQVPAIQPPPPNQMKQLVNRLFRKK